MIITTYFEFRKHFSESGLLGVDGDYEWPPLSDGLLQDPVVPVTDWSFSFPLTINLATGDTSEFHWYLSQPTAGSGAERFVLQYSGTPPVSDSLQLALTAAGSAELAVQDAATMARMLKSVFVYAKSTGISLIYVIDLFRCAFAPNSF